MTTYNTGNSIGSADPRDLYDNAQVIDDYANSEAETTTDRLGVDRATIAGIDAAARSAIAQAGYEFIGDYAAGIELTAYNQVVREAGEFWRVSGAIDLPYTTTGAGMPEGGAFVTVGDAALRQELVQPVATFNNVQDMMDATGLDVGRKVRTLGYYSPGDGGGNDYEIVTSETGTADGGSFIDLSASGVLARGLFKGQDGVHVRQFGARGNYVDWSNKGDDDWQAFQAALDTGSQTVRMGKGKFRLHEKELLFKYEGQRLVGASNNTAPYIPLSMYQASDPDCAIVPTGDGVRYIRTRVAHRSDSSSPQDEPLSAVISINANFVSLENFVIYKDIDFDDVRKDNFGADFDIAVFNACRRNVTFKNVAVLGYFNRAAYYTDVTGIAHAPGFTSPVHGQLPSYKNSNADQLYCFDISSIGAVQDFVVRGPDPAPDDNPNGDYGEYYDEPQAALVSDSRGQAGAADIYVEKYFFASTSHFTGHRRYDPSETPLRLDRENLDEIECSVMLNYRGAGASGKRGRKAAFHMGRVNSWSLAHIVVARVQEIYFNDFHSEMQGDGFAKTSTGDVISNTSDVDPANGISYGSIACLDPSETQDGFSAAGIYIEAYNAPGRVTEEHFYSKVDGYVTEKSPTFTNRFSRLQCPIIDAGDDGLIRQISSGLRISAFGTFNNLQQVLLTPSTIRIVQDSADSFVFGQTNNITHRNLIPNSDGVIDLGSSSARYSTAYLASDPIVTSDGREKEVSEISDAVLDAWGEVEYVQYRWLGAIEKKGEDARFHFGVIAQSIKDSFDRHGLDAFEYGLLCYDEWEETEEVTEERGGEYDENGEVISPAGIDIVQEFQPAGNRYGIRPAECHFLEAAYQRRRLDRLEAKIQERGYDT